MIALSCRRPFSGVNCAAFYTHQLRHPTSLSAPRYTGQAMPPRPPTTTLTRRQLLTTAAAAIISPRWATPATPTHLPNSRLLDDIEHRTFNFYWDRTNHTNGLMADRFLTPSVASITGTGFALTAWPIGVERGWITRNQARDITLRTLRFLDQLPQGDQRSGAAGYRGFYYHFLDIDTGLRLQNGEV